MLSQDSENLDINWLGLRPIVIWTNIRYLKIVGSMPMKKHDIEFCKDLLEQDLVKKNPCWVKELNLMSKMKHKVETEALCALGFDYLFKVYLPLKFQEQDWL